MSCTTVHVDIKFEGKFGHGIKTWVLFFIMFLLLYFRHIRSHHNFKKSVSGRPTLELLKIFLRFQSKGFAQILGGEEVVKQTGMMYENEIFTVSPAQNVDTIVWLCVTLIWTKAPLAVIIIAAGRSTPQLAIIATCTCTGVVFVPKEDEGEYTGSSFWISTNCWHGCEKW